MRKKNLFLLAGMLESACSSVAALPAEVSVSKKAHTLSLWPDSAHGGGREPKERALPQRGDNVIRITDVSIPSITVYMPERAAGPSAAVLVCPGGGYRILAINKEGTEIAAWLNSIGITAVVLKYRVPGNRAGAFQDAQRAVGLIRHNAKDWDIDPGRVGVIGFSAGGHLAARLSTGFEERSYDTSDEADGLSCRPDFTMLIYPAYLVKKDGALAEGLAVTSRTPKSILVQTQDDTIKVENSIYYYLALKRAKVPSELHVFPSGGHGYGLRPSNHAVSGWPKLCEAWLERNGVMASVADRAGRRAGALSPRAVARDEE